MPIQQLCRVSQPVVVRQRLWHARYPSLSHARQASATERDTTPRAQHAGLRGARPAAYIFWAAQNVRAVGQLPNPLPVLQALFDSWNVRVPAGIGVVAPVRSKAVLGEAGEQVRDGLKSSFSVVGGHVDACAACANQPFHVLLCDFSCQAVKCPSVCAPSHPWYLLLLCQSYSGKVVGQQLARARLRKQIFVCSAEMRTQTRRGIATCHSRSVDVRSSAVVALASPVRVSNWVGKGLLSSASDNLGWHSAHWEIRSPKRDRLLARRILAIWEAAGGAPSRLRLGFEPVPNLIFFRAPVAMRFHCQSLIKIVRRHGSLRIPRFHALDVYVDGFGLGVYNFFMDPVPAEVVLRRETCGLRSVFTHM